jgi:ribosomal protein S18 acetylase RimI-like enzyme
VKPDGKGNDVPANLTFRRYDAAAARTVRDLVADIHRDAYAEEIATTDPFASEEAFMTRFDAYTARDGFDLLIAVDDAGQAIGQAWGWPLTPGTGWWHGLIKAPEPDFTAEDGRRTFALSEIMVRQAFTRRGIAHALHGELLFARPEQRATLLVRPDNTIAYRAYERWGWQPVAELRPNWPDAPLMDVLILPLPQHSRP